MTDDEELIEKLLALWPYGEDTTGVGEHYISAILPIIKAERIRGGEMVKEEAADAVWDAAPYVFNYRLTKAIRALSVPAIVEAGDGDL